MMEKIDTIGLLIILSMVSFFLGALASNGVNAVLKQDVADAICEELFGPGYEYVNDEFGVETKLICGVDPPPEGLLFRSEAQR